MIYNLKYEQNVFLIHFRDVYHKCCDFRFDENQKFISIICFTFNAYALIVTQLYEHTYIYTCIIYLLRI